LHKWLGGPHCVKLWEKKWNIISNAAVVWLVLLFLIREFYNASNIVTAKPERKNHWKVKM
jgi:hypothetical protein